MEERTKRIIDVTTQLPALAYVIAGASLLCGWIPDDGAGFIVVLLSPAILLSLIFAIVWSVRRPLPKTWKSFLVFLNLAALPAVAVGLFFWWLSLFAQWPET